MKRAVLAILIAVAVAVAFAPAVYAQKAPDVVILKAANGGVKFNHVTHSKAAGAKCVICHHASKPEKPMKGAQEACGQCHTTKAAAPMKTRLQAAFHDPMAKKGICVDCHVKEVAAGKKVPAKCNDCHKKENV